MEQFFFLIGVLLASFLGNLAAWRWVFRTWRFPKIIVIRPEDVPGLAETLKKGDKHQW